MKKIVLQKEQPAVINSIMSFPDKKTGEILYFLKVSPKYGWDKNIKLPLEFIQNNNLQDPKVFKEFSDLVWSKKVNVKEITEIEFIS